MPCHSLSNGEWFCPEWSFFKSRILYWLLGELNRISGFYLKLFLGKVEAKSELAKITVASHRELWENVFKDLKDWIDVKKAIHPNRLPCSEVSLVMGTK